jgi:hypothetical protein
MPREALTRARNGHIATAHCTRHHGGHDWEDLTKFRGVILTSAPSQGAACCRVDGAHWLLLWMLWTVHSGHQADQLGDTPYL